MDELTLLQEVFAAGCEPDPRGWAAVERRVSAAIEAERGRPGRLLGRPGRLLRRPWRLRERPGRLLGRPWRLRERRWLRPSLTWWAAGTAVALIAALLAVSGVHPGASPVPAAPAWKLAGTITVPGFQGASSPQGDTQQAVVTCPVPEVCYVVSEPPPTDPAASNVAITTDGGESWQHPSLPSGVVAVTRFSCVSASVCIAGAGLRDLTSGPDGHPGDDPELLVTSDGGASWQTLPVPAPSVPMPGGPGGAGAHYTATSTIQDLACFSAQSCLLTLTYIIPEPTRTNPYQYSEGAMVMRTDDAGAHWSSVLLPDGALGDAGADAPMISCPSAQTCVVSGGYERISGHPDRVPLVWTTDDGGSTWSLGALPNAIFNGLSEAASCPDPAHCWLLGYRSSGSNAGAVLLRSGDAGRSWTVAHAPAGLAGWDQDVVDCPTALACWLVGARPAGAHGVGGEALETDDGGATWMAATLPASTGPGLGGVGLINAVSCAGADFCLALATPAASNQVGTVEQVLTTGSAAA